MSGVLTIKHTHVLLFSMYCTMYMYVHHVHWVGNSPQCRRSWWASARLLSIVLHSLTQNMRRLGKKKGQMEKYLQTEYRLKIIVKIRHCHSWWVWSLSGSAVILNSLWMFNKIIGLNLQYTFFLFYQEVPSPTVVSSRSGVFLLWELIHQLSGDHSGTVLKYGIKSRFSLVHMSPCRHWLPFCFYISLVSSFSCCASSRREGIC